jgi:gliding motility-associated lipoprotein GldD
MTIRKSLFFFAAFFTLIIASTACNGDDATATPRPRGYPRIIFPEKGVVQAFNSPSCPFTFTYPNYATIERDVLFFEDKAPSDCWFNVKIPSLNAVIYCSYYDLGSKNKFEKLRSDAFTLAGKHVLKADFIEDLPFQNNNGVKGFTFDIQGPAACPFQFYLSDSTRHFLRGAMYFNSAVQPDSLAPVLAFVKTDLQAMMQSFKWQ